MDWAEQVYPHYFAPAPQPTQFSGPYAFRYYPGTGNYLGVSGDQIWFMGAITGNNPAHVASVSDYACRVIAQHCVPADLTGDFYTVDAWVEAASPSVIAHTMFQGGKLPATRVRLPLDGDPQALWNEALYVAIEDPAGLLSPSSAAVVFDDEETLRVEFSGQAVQTAGVHTGEFRIHLCLDGACTRRLGNSPVVVPYNITVMKGVDISRRSIQLTATDGTPGLPVVLPITAVPGSTLNGQVSFLKCYGPSHMPGDPCDGLTDGLHYGDWLHLSIGNVSADGTQGLLTLNAGLVPPGSYAARVIVTNSSPAGTSTAALDVRYDMGEDPGATYSFFPAQITASATRNTRTTVTATFSKMSRASATMALKDVRYTDAAGRQLYDGGPRWVQSVYEQPDKSFKVVMLACDAHYQPCLPVGTHHARVVFSYRDDDVIQEVMYPISITVTP